METPQENMSAAEPQAIETPMAPVPEHKQSYLGPLIGVLVLVILLALGWLYFWQTGYTNDEDANGGTPAPQDTRSVPVVETTAPEDLSGIETELDAEIADLDAEFTDIDTALGEI